MPPPRTRAFFFAVLLPLVCCAAPRGDGRPTAVAAHAPRPALTCPHRVDVGGALGDVDWCEAKVGRFDLRQGRFDTWDHFADGAFDHRAARLVAAAGGDFDGDGRGDVVVAIAINDARAAGALLEWHLFATAEGPGGGSTLSRRWPGPSAGTLTLRRGRVTARAGDNERTWVFDGGRTLLAPVPVPSVPAKPHALAGAGLDDFDNAACAEYRAEEAGPWAGFDWCNQLDTALGRVRGGRVTYSESDAEGMHIDATRIELTLLKIGFGDFDGDGVRDVALASVERRVDANARGVSASEHFEVAVYGGSRAEPVELAHEAFPVAGLRAGLYGMAIDVGTRTLRVHGHSGDPTYEWLYERPGAP